MARSGRQPRPTPSTTVLVIADIPSDGERMKQLILQHHPAAEIIVANEDNLEAQLGAGAIFSEVFVSAAFNDEARDIENGLALLPTLRDNFGQDVTIVLFGTRNDLSAALQDKAAEQDIKVVDLNRGITTEQLENIFPAAE